MNKTIEKFITINPSAESFIKDIVKEELIFLASHLSQNADQYFSGELFHDFETEEELATLDLWLTEKIKTATLEAMQEIIDNNHT